MTLPSITIRHATPGDLDTILRLDQLSFSDPWPVSGWHYELNHNPNARLWVVETPVVRTSVVSDTTEVLTTNVEIVGILATWQVLDELHIGTLAVHPDYRRQGIGEKLLAVGLRESITQGVTLSHLEVRKSNLSAQGLYQKFGFEIVGERKKYYGNDGEDAILMSVYGLGKDYLSWLENGQQNEWPLSTLSSSHK